MRLEREVLKDHVETPAEMARVFQTISDDGSVNNHRATLKLFQSTFAGRSGGKAKWMPATADEIKHFALLRPMTGSDCFACSIVETQAGAMNATPSLAQIFTILPSIQGFRKLRQLAPPDWRASGQALLPKHLHRTNREGGRDGLSMRT